MLAARGGDRDAWDALVGRHLGLVWTVARSFRLSDADAADVVATTWLRLVEHLDRLREPERVGAWLATTARHESLGLLRRRTRATPTDDVLLLDGEDVGQAPAGERLETDEEHAALWRALDGLNDACRQLLRVLAADPPPSYAEVSAALDMPVGSIGPTRGRCLDRLRGLARSQGIRSEVGDS